MPRQTKKRLAQLIEQFPAIALVKSEFVRWVLNSRDPDLVGVKPTKPYAPEMFIAVQRPDFELVHLNPRMSRFSRGSSVFRYESIEVGESTEFMIAVGEYDEIVFNSLALPSFGHRYASLKGLFDFFLHKKVKYILWVTCTTWFPDEVNALLSEGKSHQISYDQSLRSTMSIIVYPRRNDMSWDELKVAAQAHGKHLENAHLFPPLVEPDLKGIDRALKEGCVLSAFSSGGGLRVVYLRKGRKNVAYGEHPHIEVALTHLNQDVFDGGLPYSKMYGPDGRYTHYLTGSTLCTSNLDAWVRYGSKFTCFMKRDLVTFQLEGLSKNPEYFVARMTKTGMGHNFWSAMLDAFNAEEVILEKKEAALTDL